MALIEVVAQDLKVRLELARLLQQLGHEALPAASPEDLVETRRTRAGAALVLAEPRADGDWLERCAPSAAVVVLAEPSASRALELLRTGAAECLPPAPTKEALGLALARALAGSGGTVVADADVPPAPPPPRSRGPLYVLLLAAAAGALWAYARRPPATVDLPNAHPAGLAWTGESFWTADWYGQALNQHDAGFRLVATAPFPAEQPVAVAWGDGLLWIAAADGSVSARRPAKSEESRRAQLRGLAISGLCHDGLYLWAADARARELVRFLPDESLTAHGRFPYPGGRPDALGCSPDGLWTFDGESAEVLRHALEDPGRVEGRRKARLPAGFKVTGLAPAGSALWAVGEREGGRGAALRLERP